MATSGLSLGGTTPLASDDAFTAITGTSLGIGIAELLSNDAPGVAFVQANPPSKCPLSTDGRSCTYTPTGSPAPGDEGTDAFTYTVRDGAGHTGTATVTIAIQLPLVARPDFYAFETDLDPAHPTALSIAGSELLANDSPGAQIVRAENPTLGEVVLDQPFPPIFEFTPSAFGLAGFDYVISWDGVSPPFETGRVTIDVRPKPPVATFTVSCVQRTCTVRTSARASQGLSIVKYLWDWGDGSPVLEAATPYPWADQTHTYSASGRFTITHTVQDSYGLTGSLALEATPNSNPVAANDAATTERDVVVTIPVLANDSDADADALSIHGVDLQTAYPGASYEVVPSGPNNSSWSLRVTPPDTYVGTIVFHYSIHDPLGATSTATVTLTVNQWSVILDAVGEQFQTSMNHSIRIPKATLLANDFHSTAAALTIESIDTSILMGSLNCTADPTACTYMPPINGTGYTLFRYTLIDPAGRRDSATVRIYVSASGHAPTAVDDLFLTTRNTAKSFTLQDLVQNDLDSDGDALAVGLTSGPRVFGSLACSTPFYLCTYTPNSGFVGLDTFPYTASDSLNPASTAKIRLLVLPPTTPTFDAREDVWTTGSGQQTSINKAYFLGNDYAPNGGPVTLTSVDATGLLGTLTCDATSCTYKPPLGFIGSTRFFYTASDGHGGSDTALVKIKVGQANTPPVAVADSLTTARTVPLPFSVFQLLKNDSDADFDPLTVTVSTSGTHLGTLVCANASYACTYTPPASGLGSDVYNYTLSDGQTSVTSTLTIQFTP